MRTEVNIFFGLLFVCSFIVSIVFTNDKNESGFSSMYKVSGEFDVSTNKQSETYETIASPSSNTSSMHGKNGEFEIYHNFVNRRTINLQQQYRPLPTRFFHSAEKILFYQMNEQMSVDLINKIGYFSTYLTLEKHYLDQNPLK